MKISVEKTLTLMLKSLTLVAVVGILLLSVGIYMYSFYQIISLGKMYFFEKIDAGKVIVESLKAVDSVLLGVIFFIIGLGLYELFIKPIKYLPAWFSMKNIDQLKATLVKVIIVVMGVSFTGRIVTWDGETDLLGYGIGMGVVIFALSYFLNIKFKKEASESQKNT